MRVQNLGWVAIGLMTSLSAWPQTAVDEVALKRLPETFSSAWATHHTRILQGRFKHSTNKPLATHVRFLRPDLKVPRNP